MSILFAILLFSILIFVHEFGHFITAKLSGVQVNEFSMFMGPAIVKWRRGETQYSIRCIPIGGYCAMEGEDEDTDNPRSFQKAVWWKRLCILLAGSFMNFVVGVLIVAVVLFCQPAYPTTQVTEIEPWSAVTQLQEGDEIVAFNGQKVRVYNDFTLATSLLEDGTYDMTVLRDGKRVELKGVNMARQPVQYEDGSRAMLYGLNFGYEETTAASVPGRILPTAMNYVRSVIVGLKSLFNGQAKFSDLGGPVQIVAIMSDVAAASDNAGYAVLNMLNIGGLIAINLAVMNLLPIPALDGGRAVALLLTTAYEKTTKKKINPKIEGYVHGVGMVLLLALMAIIAFKDIFMLVKG